MTIPVPSVPRIVEAVARHQPSTTRLSVSWRAATALVLHEGAAGPEILFIERATRPGDRWSGHMALPGGRQHDEDRDLAATAIRETAEEVGVELGMPVGRLDDVTGRVAANAVSTFVFEVPTRPELTPDPREVAGTVWAPVHALLSPDAAIHYRYKGVGAFPAVTYDGHVIWGLTYRILQGFAEVIGRRLPAS